MIAETAWQLERNVVPTPKPISSTRSSRVSSSPWISAGGLPRAALLIRQYSKLHLGLVDASLVALAERMVITTIATLDKRHFTVVRPAHCNAFELVP